LTLVDGRHRKTNLKYIETLVTLAMEAEKHEWAPCTSDNPEGWSISPFPKRCALLLFAREKVHVLSLRENMQRSPVIEKARGTENRIYMKEMKGGLRRAEREGYSEVAP